MTEDSLITYVNMAKDLTLMRLAEKGIISEDEHKTLSRSLLISSVRPNLISRWFNKTSLQLTISDISDAIIDSWSPKKRASKKKGLVSILGGKDNDSDRNKR